MSETKFGPGQITTTTPMWAKLMFRITFILTTAVTGWVAATNIFPQETKYEITLALKLLIDPVVYGLSKMFGVQTKDDNELG